MIFNQQSCWVITSYNTNLDMGIQWGILGYNQPHGYMIRPMGIDFRTFMGCIVAPRRGMGLHLENPSEWSLPESHDEQSDVMGHTMFNQTHAYDLYSLYIVHPLNISTK